jgi:hypothetical protein
MNESPAFTLVRSRKAKRMDQLKKVTFIVDETENLHVDEAPPPIPTPEPADKQQVCATSSAFGFKVFKKF